MFDTHDTVSLDSKSTSCSSIYLILFSFLSLYGVYMSKLCWEQGVSSAHPYLCRLSLLGPKIGMPLEIRVAVAKLGHPKLHCMAMAGHDNSKIRCEHGLLIFDIIPWTLAWKHWKEQEYLTQVFIQYYHQINGVELARQRIRARVRSNAHEKNTRKARISWCSGGFKPPCFHDNYYLALNTPMWILASGKRDQSRYE